jgi:hypothetical protein
MGWSGHGLGVVWAEHCWLDWARLPIVWVAQRLGQTIHGLGWSAHGLGLAEKGLGWAGYLLGCAFHGRGLARNGIGCVGHELGWPVLFSPAHELG